MRKIALLNQKGGVAKTTTTYNLAAVKASEGNRVLMIDLDPQASLTIACGIEPGEDRLEGHSTIDLFDAKKDPADLKKHRRILFISLYKIKPFSCIRRYSTSRCSSSIGVSGARTISAVKRAPALAIALHNHLPGLLARRTRAQPHYGLQLRIARASYLHILHFTYYSKTRA